MKKILFIGVVLIYLTSCSDYGNKVKHGHVEVFYKPGISIQEAQKTADLFYIADSAAHNPLLQKSVQLIKGNGDTVVLRMVTDADKLKAVNDSVFYMMSTYISDSVFKSKPVNVDFTDKYLKTIRSLSFHHISFE